MLRLPRLIAICGNPKAGKTEVQKILFKKYGYQLVDDGKALRDFAMFHLGLDHEDVYSQEGKARYTEILGKSWQHRDILGTLGKQLEDMFGSHIMPWMAVRDLEPNGRYSFGSVRKDQGYFYKGQGGVVIEVRNPQAPASRYDFDQYDKGIIDFIIDNDGLARGLTPAAARKDLAGKIEAILTAFAFEMPKKPRRKPKLKVAA